MLAKIANDNAGILIERARRRTSGTYNVRVNRFTSAPGNKLDEVLRSL